MEPVIFFVTGVIALISAIAMLTSRNAVHSALFLLLNFSAISVLFLLLRAPFLFAIQLSIYAGAIMVLFVFVVMLLGAERAENEQDQLVWQRTLGLIFGLVLLVEAVYMSLTSPSGAATQNVLIQSKVETFATPLEIGKVLFTKYLLPFELAGVILLVAIVGVIVLNRGKRQVTETGGERP